MKFGINYSSFNKLLKNYCSFQDQIESLKQEVDILKKRCERVEKEKSDILLRRLANIDTANKYTSGRTSEVLKLQQKVNELTSQNEDLRDEKKHLSLRIKEMEVDIEVSMYKIRNIFYIRYFLTQYFYYVVSTINRSTNTPNRTTEIKVTGGRNSL